MIVSAEFEEPSVTRLPTNGRTVRFNKSRRGSSFDGAFAARKGQRPVYFESLLERDFFTLLEADPNVKSYVAHGHELHYWAPGRHGEATKRSYRPDCLVVRTGGEKLMVDVKARYFATAASWVALEPHIRDSFSQLGLPFLVANDRFVRAEPRLSNSKFIYHWGGRGADDEFARFLTETHLREAERPLTISEVIEKLDADGVEHRRAVSSLCRLLLDGQARVDWTKRIDLSSTVGLGAQ